MDFSVIIPAFNAGGTLRRCLEGVIGQDFPGTYEVLVVESGDGAYLGGMHDDFPQVVFVRASRRLYSGQARNVGVKLSSGDWLAFLDADCRPAKEWLSALHRAHLRGYRVVSGALDNGNPESLVGTAEYLVSHSAYSPAIPSHELSRTTAASGNMSVARHLFEAVGGFAGTMRANDFLFSEKLHESGVDILFQGDAAASHINPEGVREFLRGQVERGYWNAAARIHAGCRGASAGRFPLLSLMLFFLRLYRMVARCARHPVVPSRRIISALPLCAAGFAAWTWGFFRASMRKNVELSEGETLPSQWRDFDVIHAGASATRDRTRT